MNSRMRNREQQRNKLQNESGDFFQMSIEENAMKMRSDNAPSKLSGKLQNPIFQIEQAS